MKIFKTILTLVCTCAVLASCSNLNETPSFSSSDSFVSFAASSVQINENGGQLVIPVNMASIDPIATSVSYAITDGTAVAGTDYEDTNDSAVLTFDGSSRSASIVIDIINREGDYTGDLSFSIELLSATGLNLGNEKTCKVTIADLDHPLAEILGEYDATATSSYDGNVSWTMTLYKDAKDVTVVWIDQLTNEMVGESARFYANVVRDDDNEIIGFVVPSGQYVGPISGYLMWLVGNTAGSGSYFPSASHIWVKSGDTFTYLPQDGNLNSIGILACDASSKDALGWWNRYDVPPTYVKK